MNALFEEKTNHKNYIGVPGVLFDECLVFALLYGCETLFIFIFLTSCTQLVKRRVV